MRSGGALTCCFHRRRELDEVAVGVLAPEPVVGQVGKIVDQLAALGQFVLDDLLLGHVVAEADDAAVGRAAVRHQQPAAPVVSHDFADFGAADDGDARRRDEFVERPTVDDFGGRHLVVRGHQLAVGLSGHELIGDLRIQRPIRIVAADQPVTGVPQRHADLHRLNRLFPQPGADPRPVLRPLGIQRSRRTAATPSEPAMIAVRPLERLH